MIKVLTALTAVMILVAIAAAGTITSKIFPTVEAVAAPPPTATIFIEELQWQVDVRTLPVTEIGDLY
jgi:hypothetical protein